MFDAATDDTGRVQGSARIGFAAREGATHLATLYHHEPLRVLLPDSHGDEMLGVIVNTGGGLVGGDALDIAVEVGAGAAAMVTAAAAEKVYRTLGPVTRVATDLRVAAGGFLDWLPQGTIVFDRARLARETTLDLADGAVALWGEIMVLGRIASGESVRHGLVHDRIDIRREGRLIWCDALRLEGDLQARIAHRAGLGGAVAMATLIVAAAGAERALDDVRAALPAREGGASCLGSVLVVRILSADPARARAGFASAWAAARGAIGRPATPPRIWHV